MDKRVLDDFKTKLKTESVLSAMGLDYSVRGEDAWLCCPFHEEATPSFHIKLDGGLYYCFGCSAKGGDLLELAKEYKKLGFVQAVEYLSNLLEIPLPEGLDEIDKSSLVGRKLAHMRDSYVADRVEEDYTDIYSKILSMGSTERAARYLESRGIRRPDDVAYYMGVVILEEYESANNALLKSFSHRRLMASGVMNDRKNLIFLNHRLLLPFHDSGRIVYLSARTLSPDTKPKYLNLADVGIPGLYNVNATVCNNTVLLCEGQTDTLSAKGLRIPAVGIAGAQNVDAASLEVFEGKRVIMAMDNDGPGKLGAEKVRGILKYIASDVFEYSFEEKDINEHVQSDANALRLVRFYRDVAQGRLQGEAV